uniref:Immunoglobulin domain-containing protein n=1 Tax=Cyprinus carpio TaxID=7962 RepID=A0A8C1XU56_CYPCA
MEGDSLTLNPDLNQTQGFKVIQWCFGDISPVIAEIYANETSYPNDEIFRDRLQLNQTGSLSIKNTRTTDSGLYKLEVQHNSGASYMTFSVTVYGVFCAETDEVKSVSVMEGDAVTLNPDLTQIKGIVLLLWRFGDKGSTVAQIDGNEILYEDDEIFIDRLQLDQSGSLTIKNTRTKHTGLYEAEISHNTGTSYIRFSVTVYESPPEDSYRAEMKSVPVTEGDPVALRVPQLYGDELIVWRFGDEGKLIAKHDIEAKSSSFYDETDERFRNRLELDPQTGSLIITNTKSTDSGLYIVKISSNKQTSYQKYFVTISVPGLSPAAVAGIVVVLLVIAAAAAAAGVLFYRRRTSELKHQKSKISECHNETSEISEKLKRMSEISEELKQMTEDCEKELPEISEHHQTCKYYSWYSISLAIILNRPFEIYQHHCSLRDAPFHQFG